MKLPKSVPLSCPEPQCGSKMVLGIVSNAWKEQAEAKGRTPANFAYFCAQRPKGCKSLVWANDDGTPRGQPLSRETKALRNLCHTAFDRIWKSAGTIPAYRKQFGNKRLRTEEDHRRAIINKLRRVTYFFMAHHMGLPEPEAHLSRIFDSPTLRAFLDVASGATAISVYDWWEAEGEALYASDFRATVRAAREFNRNRRMTSPP